MIKDLIISYIITCPEKEARLKAEELALEQSVELPKEAVKDPDAAMLSIPDILECTPLWKLPNGLTQHKLRLAFSSLLVGKDIPQLFNLLFGNISLKRGIFIEDMELPEEILALFPGPGHGIPGIRDACGSPSGPLLCCVIKPLGSSSGALSRMAGEFASAGAHFIKDDHSLADQSPSPFAERVKCVQRAIKMAGSKSVYLPNITGPHEDLEDKIAIAFNEGIRGFLISPFLTGLDTFRYLREKYPVLWMAHPAFSGTFFSNKNHGLKPGLLLGTLLSLLGADMVIYPDAAGRFSFTKDECRDIAEGLRTGYEGRFRPAMPVPAGGIVLSDVSKAYEFYGEDVMLLIGGSIYLQEDGLGKTTRRLLDLLAQPAPETGITKKEASGEKTLDTETAFERQQQPLKKGITRKIKEGVWEGREKSAYKPESDGFSRITRTELYMPEGAEAGFDVRYFEIAPGGYSSLERHGHIHLVIGARGKGEVIIGDKRQILTPNDILFIPGDCPHQLCNNGGDMFGFYCIVDHMRDKPIKTKRSPKCKKGVH